MPQGTGKPQPPESEYLKSVFAAGEFIADGQACPLIILDSGKPGYAIAGRQLYLFTRHVRSLTLGFSFAEAVAGGSEGIKARPDGKGERVIIKLRTSEKTSNAVILAGTIDVLGTYLTYEVTHARKLKRPDWFRYVTIRVTNANGTERTEHIASMDFR